MSRYEQDDHFEQKVKDAEKEITAFYAKLKQTFHYIDPLFLKSHASFFYSPEATDLQSRRYVKVGKMVNGAMKYGIICNPLVHNVNDKSIGVSPKTKHTLLPCVFRSIRLGNYISDFDNERGIAICYHDQKLQVSTMTLFQLEGLILNNEIPKIYGEIEGENFLDLVNILKTHKDPKEPITLNDKIAKASAEYIG